MLNAATSIKGIGLAETNEKWEVTFFNKKVYKETYNFPPGILANLLHIINLIVEFGPNLGKPHTKSMGGQKGLFEITASGEEGAGRSFFCYIKKQKEVVILHSIIKKSEKTPKKDLNLALKRMKDIKGKK